MKAREPKQGKSHEIPTPEVWVVPSYETDYRPVFRPPTSYLRGACGAARRVRARPAPLLTCPAAALRAAGFKRDVELLEYDLDNEDEDWLATYNDGQNRLPSEKCARAAACTRHAPRAGRRLRAGSPRPRPLDARCRRFELMLWKLELACADAQAQVRVVRVCRDAQAHAHGVAR